MLHPPVTVSQPQAQVLSAHQIHARHPAPMEAAAGLCWWLITRSTSSRFSVPILASSSRSWRTPAWGLASGIRWWVKQADMALAQATGDGGRRKVRESTGQILTLNLRA
jgi:hypothetical protein